MPNRKLTQIATFACLLSLRTLHGQAAPTPGAPPGALPAAAPTPTALQAAPAPPTAAPVPAPGANPFGDDVADPTRGGGAGLAPVAALELARNPSDPFASSLVHFSTPAKTLVIPRSSADTKDLDRTVEELEIMSRILNKIAAGGAGHGEDMNAMGILIKERFGPDSGGPSSLYLGGYGAIFLLKVNYPLLPPAGVAAGSTGRPETSSEWEEARRELTEPPVTPGPLVGGMGAGLTGGGVAYDGTRVDQLKSKLIGALKNAIHIKSLAEDEGVTVVVTGQSPGEVRSWGGVAQPGVVLGRAAGPRWGYKSGEPGGTLIIRVKKSDLAALQKDPSSPDDFKKKVSVLVR